MRIGICFGDFKPDAGGAYTYVAELLEAFPAMAAASEHHFVMLCEPATLEWLRDRVQIPNVTVVALGSANVWTRWVAGLKYLSPGFRLLWPWAGRVEWAARREDVQLLWFVGVAVFESPDMPYIATVWDLQHRLQPFFPEVSAGGIWDKRELFSARFLRRAAFCITHTQTGKREIEKIYNVADSCIRIIPLPTPKFALQAAPSRIDVLKRFGIEGRFVFYPAQFWPHKNHANLILALKWLKDRHGLELALVLSGSDKGNQSFIRDFAARQGVSNLVFFVGFVTPEELVALYRQSQALVFVTYFGPDNIPPLEAFALGCPVIASAVDGAYEQYGDAVLQVDASDPEAIGNAVWKVVTDSALRQRLVATGRDRAGRWISENYVREMIELFDKFAAVRRNWA